MRWMKKALFALGTLAAILSPATAPCDEPFERALALASEERYSEAREVLDPLLEREPGNARARLLHGILRAHAGHLNEAVDVFESLRRDRPEMPEPYNNLAVIYAIQGRLDDARRTLLAVLERQPDPVLYANLGDVYMKLARRAYRRARELEPAEASPPDGTMGAGFTLPAAMGESSGAGPQEVPMGPREPEMKPQAAVPRSREREGASGDASSTVSTDMTTAGAFCAHAGGFEERRTVADAALWLQSYGAEVLEVRHEERQVAGSYRVFLPPLASRVEAEAKLREVRGRGVRDVGLIGAGDLANGISFGRYQDAHNMHRRVAALSRLGYAVRSLAVDVKIVKDYAIRTRAKGAPTALNAAWELRFPGNAIRVVDCG